MKLVLTLSLLGLAGLTLPAQINSPKVGTARYPDGSFHNVQGIPDNMIVTDLPIDTAQAASFSDSGGLIAQDGVIRLLSTGFSVLFEFAAGEKPILSMDGELTSALAWLPVAHTLLHWNGSKFDAFEVAESDLDGTVTNLQSGGPKQARLLVRHADNTVSGVTISLRTGNLVSSETLPGVRGYAFGQGFFVVYAIDKELIVDNLSGYRRSIAFDAPDFVIERMSSTWLNIYSPTLHQSWALHLTQSELQLSLLPGFAIATSARGGK